MKRIIIGFLIVILLFLMGFAAFIYWRENIWNNGLKYEPNVVVGAVENLSDEELMARLKNQVEEGMLTISINATPSMSLSNKAAGVNWLIENPSNQGKLIRVEVFLTDTGEKIYETGALRPGTYVTDTELFTDLEVGTYRCTAMYYSYNMDTLDPIGQAGAEITLTVQP